MGVVQLPGRGYVDDAAANNTQLPGVGYVGAGSASGPATYTINLDASSYSITGQDVTLTYTPVAGSYSLALDSGTYTITGENAYADYAMAALSGSYSVAGQDVTFNVSGPQSYSITAETGSYFVNGLEADLQYSGQPFVARGGRPKKRFIIVRKPYDPFEDTTL